MAPGAGQGSTSDVHWFPETFWSGVAVPGAVSSLVTFEEGAFDDDGTMYMSDTSGGAIWIVPADGATEQWIQDPLISGDESAGMGMPVGANGITVVDGTVYVGVTELGRIVAIPIEEDGSAGEPEVYAEFATEDGVPFVDGVEVDSAGNVYATHLNMHQVVQVLPDGTFETIATADDGLDGPASVAFGPNEDGMESAFIVNLSFAMDPIVPPGGAGPGVVVVTLDDEI